VSINPGTEGGAVTWKSPVAGEVRVSGILTDADPYDGTGVAWVIDRVKPDGSRDELASGIVPNGGAKRLDQGRRASRLGSIRVEPGDRLSLSVRLGSGDAHYDITNVEFSIACSDGSAAWDLHRDLAPDFLAANPHADRRGHPAVWSFEDMAGSHRLERMPAVDALLARWDSAAGAGHPDHNAIDEAAAAIDREIMRAGRESPLMHDLTGPRSPYRVEPRDDTRLPSEARDALAKITAELAALKAGAPSVPCANAVQDGGLKYSAFPGFGDAALHVRGSYERLGPRVPRRFPRALAGSDQSPITSGSGRAELGRWLGSADNPLAARVMVNRIWQHHFGEGIVRTPSNFGVRGSLPSHPELLDELALAFMESGWSIKAMHRTIMRTRAYQQSSRPTQASLAADPENRIFGRMNRRRLDAEELHDSLLALSGRLEERPGGPAESDLGRRRRLVYLKTSRSGRSGFGSIFDLADPSLHVEARTNSTVAPQALFLMNHPFVQEQARGLAERVEIARYDDPDQRITALYRLIFGRPAIEPERAVAREFVAAAQKTPATKNSPGAWERYAQALLLTNEFLYVD
jgi:hypothetical protein